MAACSQIANHNDIHVFFSFFNNLYFLRRRVQIQHTERLGRAKLMIWTLEQFVIIHPTLNIYHTLLKHKRRRLISSSASDAFLPSNMASSSATLAFSANNSPISSDLIFFERKKVQQDRRYIFFAFSCRPFITSKLTLWSHFIFYSYGAVTLRLFIGWNEITLHPQPIKDERRNNIYSLSFHGACQSSCKDHAMWKIVMVTVWLTTIKNWHVSITDVP